MSATVRLTCAQALVRYLAALRCRDADEENAVPLFGGVFAIFGHGNVAGLGEALHAARDELPTFRAHNEQAMAHAAIAYAKTNMRRRMMAVTTSIGPGATNLVTAAALAHVNRLPVLLLPGDIFVSRAPDPVLQQLEDFSDGTVSVNDCLRPVSRYFDRIVRPEQLLTALPRAVRALTDAAACGPVTLALPQDVQTEAYDFPASFFEPREIVFRAPIPTDDELMAALDAIEASERPVIVAGGGTLYARATPELIAFADRHGVPVCETQAGKGAMPWNHPLQLGPAGVTGSTAANTLLRDADLVIAVGTRLQDFTTGSNALFRHVPILSVNVNAFDSLKGDGVEVVGDAAVVLDDLSFGLEGWAAPEAWTQRARDAAREWVDTVTRITGERKAPPGQLPYDGEVIGAVQRSSPLSAQRDIVVCAAGTLPAELEKLWRTETAGGYHMEYGYSCMGYEIAGGLGAKMAAPDREVIVMVGDGSYLMMNSEIATSVMLDAKLIVVVLDNRGYGCINRLQQATGSAPFNNMFDQCVQGRHGAPHIDFAAHARAMGAIAEHVADIAGLEAAMERARAADRTYLICIDTDHTRTTADGGAWWEVAVPEVSTRESVRDARAGYESATVGRKAREHVSMKNDPIRIGINPISWSNDDLPSLGGETPLSTALTEGKAIGYEGFELGNKFPKDPTELRELMAGYGLDVVSGWYSGRVAARSAKEECEAVGKHLRLLAENGCKVMVYGEVADAIQGEAVPLYKRPRFRTAAEWKAYGDRLTEFAKFTLSHGVRLAYHHHMGAYVESPDDLDRLMENTGDDVGLLFDSGHTYFGGGDPLTVLDRHIERICHVHCKDVRPGVVRIARNRHWTFLQSVLNGAFTVPGDGIIDFAAIIERLKSHGYRGWLVVEAEQDPSVAPSYEFADKGYRTLRSLLDRETVQEVA